MSTTGNTTIMEEKQASASVRDKKSQSGSRSKDPPMQQQQQQPPQPVAVPNSNSIVNNRRVVTLQELDLFNLFAQPVFIFDYTERRNRWSNPAGLRLWNAASLTEYQARDMTNMSPATIQRNQQIQASVERPNGFEEDQWTFYPQGSPPVTAQVTITGICLANDDGSTHICMLCQCVPVAQDVVSQQSLRGVDMLRHLPMAVCQFDMEGNVMFQNQAARLPPQVTAAAVAAIHNKKDLDQKNNDNDNNAVENKNGSDSVDESLTKVADTTSAKGEDDTAEESATAAEKNTQHRRSPQEGEGHLLHRFVNPQVAQEALAALQKNSPDQHVVQIEADLYSTKHPGQTEWSEVQLRKTTDPITGKPAILYSAQDKTDAQNAQKERQASLQKSEFFAIMAHEIRTPLHQVIGFIDLLDQTSPLTKSQKGYIKLLQTSAEGLMTVISDVLDYSKLDAGEMKTERVPYEPLSVVEGSMAAVKARCEEKQLSLSLNWDKGLPFRLVGDPNRLRQILLNLLSNAIKFTEHGGIQVMGQHLKATDPFVTKHRPARKESIAAVEEVDDNNNNNNNNNSDNNQCGKEKDWIKISVSDTGMGISEEHQELVFQQYQQGSLSVARNFGGTGLGLSICQLLIKGMEGSVGVESRLGEGSRFWFLLPAHVPHLGTLDSDGDIITDEDRKVAEEEERTLHILVVEDNRINQKLMVNMLKRLGHKTAVADNGQIAINMVQDEDVDPYDVVLMDMQVGVRSFL